MASILEIEQLNVSYNGIPALQNVGLQAEKGEILGIVGESGSGKSTLLKAVIGLLGDNGRAESGRVVFEGTDLLRVPAKALRGIRGARLGMIFQNPGTSFNPIRKIGDQFLEAMRSHGKTDRTAAIQQILEMLARLGLRDGERILYSYPFELSGGMNQRVAIALAMILRPQLLLADEPTSALDVTVQAQCVKEMMDLRDSLGTTILLVTHNMGVVSYMADKVAVMYAGRIVEYGAKADVLNCPRHPYTRALIEAIPQIGGGAPKGIQGQPSAAKGTPDGCDFSSRCRFSDNICAFERPVMNDCGQGHAVFCHKCFSEVLHEGVRVNGY